MNASIADLIAVTPMWLLFLTSLMPLSLKLLNSNQEPWSWLSTSCALIGATGVLSFVAQLLGSGTEARYLFGQTLVLDPLAAWASLLVAICLIAGVLLAHEHDSTRPLDASPPALQFSEHLFLLMNAALGMLVVLWSNDLIVSFVGIELMSLCLYLTLALNREAKISKEAAIKYFILGSFASAIFLYGVALIFGAVGSTYLTDIASLGPELISISRLFLIGVALLVVGLLFKIGLVPFHAWLPDVYQGSSTPVVAFMAAAVKLVVFVLLLRLIGTQIFTSDRAHSFAVVLQWLAVASVVAGNAAALMQERIKRVLAYSSIAHSGYIMMGLVAGLGVWGELNLGTQAVLFYLLSYVVMSLGAFAVVALMEANSHSVLCVSDLRGLAYRRPYLAGLLTLLLLSLAGLPPLVGFFSKFFLFSAVLRQGWFWLAAWGVLGSLVGLYYYLRPVVCMYMHTKEAQEPAFDKAPLAVRPKPATYSVIFMAAGFVIVAGLLADFVFQWLVAW